MFIKKSCDKTNNAPIMSHIQMRVERTPCCIFASYVNHVSECQLFTCYCVKGYHSLDLGYIKIESGLAASYKLAITFFYKKNVK